MMESDRSIAIVQPKIRSLESPESFEYAGAAGGFLDILAYPFCQGRLFETIENDTSQYDREREIFWASGAAMVVRKSVWDALGGFDESYFAHQEEIDFCWRASRFLLLAQLRIPIRGRPARPIYIWHFSLHEVS